MNSNPSLRAIFNEALDRSDAAERARYLDEACGADAVLRERIEKLLRAHDEAEGFFSEPNSRPQPDARMTLLIPDVLLVTEKAGDRIGRYKLLQQIGEGGCGVVYMAEQEEPVRRRVALKVIKLGMDTKQVIARFEAERQALALMDHPNIAKVLDAGATDSGRPYFVMELVRGIKITEYCDQNNLSTEERLKLFAQVCHAIQHAHQKGIIHRDIKPSNILVTISEPGSPGCPKVIDFGIAKATTDQRLTDKTVFTAFEQFIGTPAYMSPEQAMMTSLDIDTRTDIYALGVLLYELLTGQTPFDAKELMAAGLDAMRRIIHEQEPARPSTRLSTMLPADLTTIARHRQAEPARLSLLLRGDLDWIVMKALEKDRARRYETANGLAADIRRHLQNEPVVARPVSNLYRFQKLVRRNKLAFAAVTAVSAALIIGLSVSTWMFTKEKEARRRAVAAEQSQSQLRQQAETQRERAENLSEQNRQGLYAARITLAQRAFEEGSMVRMAQLLEELNPKEGEEDLRGFEWYYLRHLLHLERLQLRADTRETRAVAFSPNGKSLATAGADSTIILWDPHSGIQQRVFSGHTGTVHTVAFSPDGKFLASGADDLLVKIWDMESGRAIATLAGHHRSIASVAFSSDGRFLASGSKGRAASSGTAIARFSGSTHGDRNPGEAIVWEIGTGRQVRNLVGHINSVLSVAFSPDGATIATAGSDTTVRLWDTSTGAERLNLAQHQGPVYSLAFSPDGTQLITGSHDQTAILWNTQTGSSEKVLRGHAGAVFSTAFSPDGNLIATGGYDNVAKLWDAATGLEKISLRGLNRYVWAAAFSPDSQTLATASWDGTVNLWNTMRRYDFDVLPQHRSTWSGAYSLAFSPDGKSLATASLPLGRIWNLNDLTEQLNFPVGGDPLVRYTADGNSLVTADMHGALQVFDVPSKMRRISLQASTQKIWALAISPDSTTAVTGDWEGRVRFWNTETGENEMTFPPDMSFVRALAFSPDGKTLIVLGRNQSKEPVLCFWDMPGQRIRKEILIKFPASFVVFSPDGKTFAISQQTDTDVSRALHANRVITLWDAQTGEVRAALPPQSDIIYDASFSPDSKTLATASWDGTVRLWHVATGSELITLKGHTKGVMFCVAFSPDGRQLVGGTGRDVTGDNIVRWITEANEHYEVRYAFAGLVSHLRGLGKFAEAAAVCREELERARQLAGNEQAVAAVLHTLSELLSDKGELDEAEEAAREALAIRRKVLPPDHLDRDRSHRRLSGLLQERGKIVEAQDLLRKEWENRTKELGDMHPAVMAVLERWIELLCVENKWVEAEALLNKIMAAPRIHAATLRRLSDFLAQTAYNLDSQGKLAEAEVVWRMEVDVEKKLSGPDHPFVANSLDALIVLLKKQNKLAEAEAVNREALLIHRNGPDLALRRSLDELVDILVLTKQFAEAEPLARECLVLHEKAHSDQWPAFSAQSILGGILLSQNKYTEAEQFLLSGYEGMEERADKIPVVGKTRPKEALQRLVELYELTERKDQAVEWRKKLAEMDKTTAEKESADVKP
jgi:eukaryotic-like serine/threonine-protein kinase